MPPNPVGLVTVPTYRNRPSPRRTSADDAASPVSLTRTVPFTPNVSSTSPAEAHLGLQSTTASRAAAESISQRNITNLSLHPPLSTRTVRPKTYQFRCAVPTRRRVLAA